VTTWGAEQLDAALDDVIREQMERWKVPGLAVAVFDRGAVSSRGYGVTSIETGQPVTPNTLFRIASISKTFTATLVLIAVDRGLVDLDTPVVRYLPDLPLADEGARETVTLRHLLTHTGGFESDDWRDTGQGDDALSRYVAGFQDLRQLAAPGHLWAYSNTGLSLAGHVVATVLQQPFERAMHEHVVEPLGLERTVMFPHEAIVYPVAIGHTATPDGLEINRRYAMPRGITPAGGVISTVEDLMAYAAFHMGDGATKGRHVLSEGLLRAMQEPEVEAAGHYDACGLGWMMRFFGDTRTVEHTGDILGLESHLALVPEQSFAVAALTNSSNGAVVAKAVVDRALERYCGLRWRGPERIALTPEQLEPCAGAYAYPLGAGADVTRADVTVAPKGGGLFVTVEVPDADPQPFSPFHLEPVGKNRFIAAEGEFRNMRVDFIPNADGSVRYVRLFGRLAEPRV
jgi:CubicO group peptidase (beta-lactamase class C family)